MNVVGSVDLLHNAVNAVRFEAAPHVGAQWVAVGVPMMAVVYVGIFVLLPRRADDGAHLDRAM